MGSCATAPKETCYNTNANSNTPQAPIQYNTVPKRNNTNSSQRSSDYHSDSSTNENNNILINIPIRLTNDENTNDTLTIHSFPYNQSMKISDILQETITIINKKYYPKAYTIRYIKNKSFFVSKTICADNSNLWNETLIKSITNYQIYEISKYGLEIFIVNEYEHQPYICNTPMCEYISNNNNNINALKCPIYRSMINYCDFTAENYNHLLQFNHIKNTCNNRPKCEECHDCESFINIQKGSDNIYDKCHMKLYSHPPREMRQINISETIHNMISNKLLQQNHTIYHSTNEDTIKYKWNSLDGFMSALIVEVISNGYCSDLKMCENDIKINAICEMVDIKMNNIRHKQISCPLNRGEMLALILYTNGQCCYDLCKSQRNGNYNKWKWFDYCLYNAIRQISRRETGQYELFVGVKNCKIYKKKIRKGYFDTYVSTTWNKQIPLNWVKNDGIIIEIDKEYRKSDEVYCCDVSWISNVPHECEVVIARSIGMEKLYANDSFILSVSNEIETDGIRVQSVVLNKAASYDTMCSPIV